MRAFLLLVSLLLVLVATSDAHRRSFGVSQSSSNGKVDRAKLVSIRKIKEDQKSRTVPTAEQVFSSSCAPERFTGF
jgi:hypothetical protein